MRAPALERMRYDAAACQVRYVSVKRNQERCVSGLDFLADLSASIPDRGEHSVTYHGRYSNRSRGTRRRQESEAVPPATAEARAAEVTSPLRAEHHPAGRKAFRLAWAALLARVWNVDAMKCRRCGSKMRVVAGLTKPTVVERILRHLGLWDIPGPPARHACPSHLHPLFGQNGVAPEDIPDPDPGWPEADPPFPED